MYFVQVCFVIFLSGVRGWASNMSQNLLPNKQVAIPQGGSLQLDQRDLNARGHICIYKQRGHILA